MSDSKLHLSTTYVIESDLNGIEFVAKSYFRMSGWVIGDHYTERVGSNEFVIKVGIANEISVTHV